MSLKQLMIATEVLVTLLCLVLVFSCRPAIPYGVAVIGVVAYVLVRFLVHELSKPQRGTARLIGDDGAEFAECPTDSRLRHFVDEKLASDKYAQVRAHLSLCVACRQRCVKLLQQKGLPLGDCSPGRWG